MGKLAKLGVAIMKRQVNSNFRPGPRARKRVGRSNPARWVVMTYVTWVGLLLSSCSHSRPPALPVVSIYSKTTNRIEVSEIIVRDPKRREDVRAIYETIAGRIEALQSERAVVNAALVQISAASTIDETAVRHQVSRLRREQTRAYREYVALQLRLRDLMTEKEFNKLGKFD